MHLMEKPASTKQLCLYFLKLGSVGFGGPAALINFMHRDLVEDRKWITNEEFTEGFALAQLCPGPIASQLAIYLGWLRGRMLGATAVGVAFVLPSFLLTLLIAYAYIQFGSLEWLQKVFYTVGAAVIGIIINSTYKLVKRAIGHDRVLLAIWFASALLTALTEAEFLWFFFVAGTFAVIMKMPPRQKTLNTVVPLGTVLLYFAKAGLFVFGSGLAVIPYLHAGVVQEFGWLTERQFMDAVAVAMITPGPVVVTAAFIGCLVAGTLGAIAAMVGTFLPCYLLTLILAPRFSRLSKFPRIKIFVSGITAAAIGAIGGACWILGKKSIVDIPTAAIAIITVLLLMKTKIPEPFIILAAAGLGLFLQFSNLA